MGRQELGGEISVWKTHGKVHNFSKKPRTKLNINLCQYLFMTKEKNSQKLEINFFYQFDKKSIYKHPTANIISNHI